MILVPYLNGVLTNLLDWFVIVHDQIFWEEDVVLTVDCITNFLSGDALVQVTLALGVS